MKAAFLPIPFLLILSCASIQESIEPGTTSQLPDDSQITPVEVSVRQVPLYYKKLISKDYSLSVIPLEFYRWYQAEKPEAAAKLHVDSDCSARVAALFAKELKREGYPFLSASRGTQDRSMYSFSFDVMVRNGFEPGTSEISVDCHVLIHNPDGSCFPTDAWSGRYVVQKSMLTVHEILIVRKIAESLLTQPGRYKGRWS